MTEERNAPHTPEMRKKANSYFFAKVAFNVILIVLGALLIGALLRRMQTQASIRRQNENSQLALNEALTTLQRNEDSAEGLEEIYHQGSQQILNDIELVLSGGLSEAMVTTDDDIRAQIMQEAAERAGVDYLFVLARDGRIMISPDRENFRINPAVTGILTQENINSLLNYTNKADGTVQPVQVKNRFGTFWFYSRPYYFWNEEYALVIGLDSSVLDEQTGTLRDVSAVLRRTAVINDGFLFAVNKSNSLFLYFNNGEDMLTGRNALQCGLSRNALSDGYSGVETIQGQEYYCVSRIFNDQAVICATARTDRIVADDRFVLFWTIMGFHIVMMVSLAYAVIVRNDFVRHAVATDRVVLRKDSDNPIYFDKSVFRKVFPLMLVSIMIMYGISYYTQTLLEVTQGVEKSAATLQEVTGRYEESIENREALSKYNDEHFLSTARLLSFVVEEMPDILNEQTGRYYSIYDDYGNRVFLTDDEGNRLQSVDHSAMLQKLCDNNSIDSIYIFDEDGRTIATNTGNWFFTLSHDAEAQSYPFLAVLDGRTDDYIQARQTNDLGEDSQFIGTAMRYYTMKDEDGGTHYVSRSAFEQSAATSGLTGTMTGDGITEHRSLLQIEMSESLSDRLLEPTSAEWVLTTSMLSGGGIVMFDTSSDHLCVYSPMAASIGRPAAELGIPDNAFSGLDYYGFTRIDGISYFQYFRYLDDYFIATFIPKSTMYTTRVPISLMTAVVCFILILFLSLTVTLTNKEEEMLYQVISEEEAERGLNASIFNIILPSGRQTSTTNAAARWDNRHVPWSEKAPEQKLIDISKFIIMAMIIYTLLIAFVIPSQFHESSVLRYILGGSWTKGWNVFALSACALVLMSTVILVAVCRIPVNIISSMFGARSETLGHLLLSILKYGGTIGALFYCLYLVGLDAGGLLASVGILSLVIGLGAQSLIQDIIAGIFIVFEGEFRVGDIVTIKEFRGTVLDIGLRTTKIMGMDGNIKIFNNSEISGVLNMTKETSVAMTTISIEYGQDIDYVEAVLARDLPALKENNPKILDGPTYLGVSELGASGVSLRVIARCREEDVRGMNRYLNREVLQIFYRNGINVPFNNVTLSNLDPSPKKTMADFLAEQEEKKK